MADEIESRTRKRSRSKRVLIIVVIFLLLILLGGGGYLGYAWMKHLPPFEPMGPTPEEIALEKAQQDAQMENEITEYFVTFPQGFTFNLQAGDKKHMMQIEVALVVIGSENERLARDHLPLISSVISEIAAQQQYEALIAQSGRQRLKRILLEGIRSRLSGVIHEPVVEQVLFTNFVIQ